MYGTASTITFNRTPRPVGQQMKEWEIPYSYTLTWIQPALDPNYIQINFRHGQVRFCFCACADYAFTDSADVRCPEAACKLKKLN